MEKLNRIKSVLVERDISQTWLAEKLGKGKNAINSWCNQRTQPNLYELKKIADLLEMDMGDLLEKRQKS